LILLIPAVITIAGIYFYGVELEARFRNWRILPVLVLYPLWGLLQQFMIAGLIAGNLKKLESVKLPNSLIIIITSIVFALIHAPGLPLMIYVFVMELIFLTVYFKYHNLWALGLFHGWVSGLFLYYVLERDLWKELWVIF
ncbi:MAG: CPBP family glutamic-type intramembrane protease, partial [Bacteroidales bacterium]